MSDLKDPRVFFAAERTLMAWTRTGLTLIAFGFMLERFGLFMHMLSNQPGHLGRDFSFWIGIAFIVLAIWIIAYSVVQYRRVLKTLNPAEFPENYTIWAGIAMNVAVVALGIALITYLFTEL